MECGKKRRLAGLGLGVHVINSTCVIRIIFGIIFPGILRDAHERNSNEINGVQPFRKCNGPPIYIIYRIYHIYVIG